MTKDLIWAKAIFFQVSNGVVKMNVDTDTQWAYWDGLRGFYKKNEGYLQGQVCKYLNAS